MGWADSTFLKCHLFGHVPPVKVAPLVPMVGPEIFNFIYIKSLHIDPFTLISNTTQVLYIFWYYFVSFLPCIIITFLRKFEWWKIGNLIIVGVLK
jgi:hypothetical protein